MEDRRCAPPMRRCALGWDIQFLFNQDIVAFTSSQSLDTLNGISIDPNQQFQAEYSNKIQCIPMSFGFACL
jgi:hypothetical protein